MSTSLALTMDPSRSNGCALRTRNRSRSKARSSRSKRMIPTKLRTNEMEMEPERDRVLCTADRDVAEAAIAQVASCEACNPDADWPECTKAPIMRSDDRNWCRGSRLVIAIAHFL